MLNLIRIYEEEKYREKIKNMKRIKSCFLEAGLKGGEEKNQSCINYYIVYFT